jgi:hypothetical protein
MIYVIRDVIIQLKKNSKDLLFSQRMGITPSEKMFQIDSMDNELRNGLWNAFYKYYFEPSEQWQFGSPPIIDDKFRPIFREIWEHYLKLSLSSLSILYEDTGRKIKELFNKWEYNKVYDFIDWIARLNYDDIIDIDGYIKYCNMILERENSAYRFIDKYLTQITDQIEIKEIEKALQISDELGLQGVKEHIKSALQLLSDRENPDFKNSFKESISAVESISKIISGKPKSTLGDALNEIEKKIGLHGALKNGYSAIYGYASSSDGIRHGSIDESKVDYDDAKYMLVSCSAFVNYLIVKAQKGGITF